MAASSAATIEPVLGTVSALVATNVPVVDPQATAGAVRTGLVGHTYDEVDDLAVCIEGRLVGMVTIEALTAAAEQVPMVEIMDPDPPSIAPGVDQEQAAWRMVQRRESGLAVVGDDDRFIGVIPPYRMLGALLGSHDRDMARLGGFLHDSSQARRASEEPVHRRLWHRLPWLLVGLAGAMVAALIVGGFEDALAENVLIALFIPGIVYMADAVGTQTETLIVRGISVGVSVRQVVRLEAVTGLCVGLILATVFFPLGVLIWGEVDVAFAVAVALFAACSTATLVALTLPWAFHRLGVDPAFGSGPLATVIQDLLSILIYFGVVELLL